MGLLEVKLPILTSFITSPDFKTTHIVSAIYNIQNINRLREMDNLAYQISLK